MEEEIRKAISDEWVHSWGNYMPSDQMEKLIEDTIAMSKSVLRPDPYSVLLFVLAQRAMA